MEAKMLSDKTVPDLDALNASVEKFETLLSGDIAGSLSVGKRNELLSDTFYKFHIIHKQRHLFKLTEYLNPTYGQIWVAYLSYPNPRRPIDASSIDQGIVFAKENSEFKAIASMTVALSDSTLVPVGWTKDLRNPEGINIHDFGELIYIERFASPKDDGFSVQDYEDDK